jgi:peptidoglycan glycosyltransferase
VMDVDDFQDRSGGMNRLQPQLQRLSGAIVLAFLLVGLALVFWSVMRASVLLAREDNPRLVEAELRLQRGRIVDTNNVVLAETVGPVDNLQRVYPLPYSGPAVGYYSFRHGTAGVEAGYDEVLRGVEADFWQDFWRQLVHQPQVGRDVRLTLDASWQRTADVLLGENRGAIILLSLPDASIRAMVSHPLYDPNELEERFEELVDDETAPLLNRAAQGQYQPGLALQPFILAAAVNEGLIRLDEVVEEADRAVLYGAGTAGTLACASTPPAVATWRDVLAHGCPAPMLALADELGAAGLDEIFHSFGLTATLELPLATEATAVEGVDDPTLAMIGQENLTVTPLQMSLALAALANEGRLPWPQLVMSVQDEAGAWQPVTAGGEEVAVVSPAAAGAILAALPRQENVAEYATLALAGPGGTKDAWYLGLAPAGAPQYMVVVLVEESESAFEAQRLGRALLKVVLGGR